MQFLDYQILDADNLLCCATEFTREGILKTLCKLNSYIAEFDVQKKANMYMIIPEKEAETITMGISIDRGDPEIGKDFIFKNRIHLEQAIKTRHEGDLLELGKGLQALIIYIKSLKLDPITQFCCRILSRLDDNRDIENTIVDIYVGVNRNIL